MKKFLAVMAMTALASAAQAATISYTDSFGLQTTNWTNPLTALPQFNAALGTLTGVSFIINGDIAQSIKAENTGLTPDVLTPVAGATMALRNGTTALSTLTLSNTGASFSAAAFDGTSDFAGPSGTDFGILTANGTLTFSPANLASFIGSGDLGAFNVRAVGAGAVQSDNGNLDTSISTQARYSLTLTYTYDAVVPPAIPEPGSLALVGLALAGMGAAARRRKA